MRRLPTGLLLLTVVLATPAVGAQAPPPGPQAAPAFEAASIKPNASASPRSGIQNSSGGRVTITNLPVRNMISTAYGPGDLEVVGGPDWLGRDRWDVTAVGPPGDPDAPWQPMLQSLLVERFRLKAHIETRNQPVFWLVPARRDRRLGPQLTLRDCGAPTADCGDGTMTVNGNGIRVGTMTARSRTMAELGVTLSRFAERRVFDRTGLAGRYDVQLTWSEDLSIFTALEEQLGLKLEPGRGPVDVVVVESIEKPTPD